ncbi:MAG: hypothetical protein HMLIMOIP_000256 [Candidatus Nitrosomirales archaeon]|jgi:hypothetical protein
MLKVLKMKYLSIVAACLVLMLYLIVTATNNSYNQADAQLEILATPGLGRSSGVVAVGGLIKVTISASQNAPHVGNEIAIWDGVALPLNLPSSCPLSGSGGGGIKWQLRADTDGDNNFEDSPGSSVVAYSLDSGDGFSLEFGNGGLVTITPVGTPIILPNGLAGPYAWIVPTGSGSLPIPTDPIVPGPGTDKIFFGGPTFPNNRYEVATCGTEVGGGFQQGIDFLVGLPQTTLTKTPDKETVIAGGSVKYTYKENNIGGAGLTDVFVKDDNCGPSGPNTPIRVKGDINNNGLLDFGESWVGDSNGNGKLDGGEDTNLNGILDPGEDRNSNSILDSGEMWTFECTKTLTSTVTNHAFAEATACSDDITSTAADCNFTIVGGKHTGNSTVASGMPDCLYLNRVASNMNVTKYPMCDPGERASSAVTVIPSLPGTIKIIKNTLPNDPQDFSFTHNITSNPAVQSPFKLDDDSNPTLSNTKTFLQVPAGSYRVTETTVLSIPLQSIVCIDPTGDSFRSGNSADIELDAAETVTCTFTNGIVVPSCGTGRLPEQPEDAISMTSIRSNSIIKTIHAEKQVFNCQLPQGSIPVIADVTIIAEIYQDINTKTVLSKQVEVVTCVKDPATIRVLECNLSIPSTDRVPVTNCQELPIEHPQEMDTITKGSTAKTIETQKEVFTCTMNTPNDITDDKKVDLVLFTEIYQNLNTLTSQNPTMLSMKCVIKIDTVLVESCQFRQVNS